MARQKGKSKRRIKSLEEHAIDERAADAALSPQSLSERGVKIPAHRLAAQEDNLESLPRIEGMVVGLYPGGAMVRADGKRLLCNIAKTFRPPAGSSPLAVGDDVTVALTQDQHADGAAADDKDRSDGMLIARRPRETLLTRPQPTSAKRRDEHKAETFQKVIVANMDMLLVVVSVKKPL